MSADGMNWTNAPAALPLRRVAYDDNTYVATGLYGKVASSVDGTNWIARNSGTYFIGLAHLVAADGVFTAVGGGGTVIQATVGEPQAVLSIQANPSGTIELTGSVDIGRPYTLQRSEDLNAWQDVDRFVPVQAVWQFFDSAISAGPRRFYRLVPGP